MAKSVVPGQGLSTLRGNNGQSRVPLLLSPILHSYSQEGIPRNNIVPRPRPLWHALHQVFHRSFDVVSDTPVDHSSKGLAVAPGADRAAEVPSPLPEHEPCLVRGTILPDDPIFLRQNGYKQQGHRFSGVWLCVLPATYYFSTVIRRNVFGRMLGAITVRCEQRSVTRSLDGIRAIPR